MDVLFIMMEKVQEGFCKELLKLANQYGYKLNKAAYRTMKYAVSAYFIKQNYNLTKQNNQKVP